MSYEYKVYIAGVEYGMEDIKSAKIEQPLFDKMSVGNACSAQLEISLWPKAIIPRTAEIIPWTRDTNVGGWYQLGIFYIDTRAWNGDLLEVTAYDCMLKSEVVWEPRQNLKFPMTMQAASKEIAQLMGTTLDPRCAFNGTYTIDYPANNYTLRAVLQFIAGAHVGNWIVTSEGKLLLIPLGSEPPETHYLVTEDGDAIVIGGVKILI